MICGRRLAYGNCLEGDSMIYKCNKCEYFFKRKNEPSKCPSCENHYVVGANNNERQAFKHLHGDQRDAKDYADANHIET